MGNTIDVYYNNKFCPFIVKVNDLDTVGSIADCVAAEAGVSPPATGYEYTLYVKSKKRGDGALLDRGLAYADPRFPPSETEIWLRTVNRKRYDVNGEECMSQAPKGEVPMRTDDESDFKFAVGVSVIIGSAILLLSLLTIVITGTTTIDVPAGSTAYVYSKPMFFSGGGFVKALPGPSRMNFCWRKYSINVETMQHTIDENFSILAKDDLTIAFSAHIIMSVRSDEESIKAVVEQYYGSEWYTEFLSERFRSCIYDAVRAHDSRSAKEQRGEIAGDVRRRVQEITDGTPFVIHDIVMGNIQYPETVQKAVEQKLASQQQLEQMDMTVQIAKKQAEAEIEKARGIAGAQQIINGTLTTQYLRHEYVQALLEAGKSPSSTIIYVPLGSDGLPFVLDAGEAGTRQGPP